MRTMYFARESDEKNETSNETKIDSVSKTNVVGHFLKKKKKSTIPVSPIMMYLNKYAYAIIIRLLSFEF